MIQIHLEKTKLKKYKSLLTQLKNKNSLMRQNSTRSLKRSFQESTDRIEKLAILIEMSKRFLGKTPFDVQLIAALAMHDGYVLNMLTGEGKTIAGALAAALFASEGKQVMVTTANEYLSNRDSVMMQPLFDAVGIESGVLGSNKNAQVLFKSLLGGCLDWLRGFISNSPSTVIQKSLFKKDDTVMIVDEIDYSLIELSITPMHIVSATQSTYNPDFIRNLVLKANNDESFYKSTKEGGYELTDAFYEYADQFLIDEMGIKRSELNSTHYGRYIEFQNAYIAEYILLAGRDYVVDTVDLCIKRFNKRTGRSSVGGFEHCILNFLHKKEQLPPPIENEEVVTSTLKYYIHSFGTVVGMSGTSECNRMELNKTYGLKVLKIPARVDSKLIEHGYAIYSTEEQKTQSLLAFVNSRLAEDRPVMLVCEDNLTAGEYYDMLSMRYDGIIILLGEDEKSEAELLKNAGKNAQLTITTRMCARGTDITVEHDEGLSLVVSGLGVTDVDDLQLNGRTARSGKKGEVIFFASVEDPLLVGVSNSAYLKLCCHTDESFYPDKINGDFCQHAISVVRRMQSECVKAAREQRNMILAYQSPIESQLEIMKKKRFELWEMGSESGSAHAYMTKMINMVYTTTMAEAAQGVIDRFCALHTNYHAVISELLNQHLTDLWADHNGKMRRILTDSFGGTGLDLGKYNEKCYGLFVDFAESLNEKLVFYVVSCLDDFIKAYSKEISKVLGEELANSNELTSTLNNASAHIKMAEESPSVGANQLLIEAKAHVENN